MTPRSIVQGVLNRAQSIRPALHSITVSVGHAPRNRRQRLTLLLEHRLLLFKKRFRDGDIAVTLHKLAVCIFYAAAVTCQLAAALAAESQSLLLVRNQSTLLVKRLLVRKPPLS